MEIKRLDENGKVTQAFYEFALQCCKDGIEIWVDIDGYEGMYCVSNMGRVKSLGRKVLGDNGGTYNVNERLLKLQTSCGYVYVGLHKHTFSKNHTIHRLVAIHFIPNLKNKPDINHDKGIKTMNCVGDIYWSTKSENTKHAYRTGLKVPNYAMRGILGENNPSSKPIIQFDKNGNIISRYVSATYASKITNTSICHISSCANGKRKSAGGFIWKYERIAS